MKKNKHVGFNYLHRHPKEEQIKNLDSDHVIVDRKDWEEVVEYFIKRPDEVDNIETVDSSSKKVPIGIEPKYIWEERRLIELSEAIKRYCLSNEQIPIKWIEEYNELNQNKVK